MDQLEYLEKDGTLECVFTGSLSTVFCQQFEQSLKERIDAATGNVVFDFKGVDFVSSAFLRVCLHTLKATGKDRFRIVNVPPEVKKIFAMVGFDGMAE